MQQELLKSIEFIETHLHEPISLEDIAAVVNKSQRQLLRYYQEFIQTSIKVYLRERRLTEASRALVNSQRRITDIALDCHFNSPETFSRAFYRSYACLPSVFRAHGVEQCPAQLYPLCEDDLILLKQHQQHSRRLVSLPSMSFMGLKLELKNEGEPTEQNHQYRMQTAERVVDILRIDPSQTPLWEVGYRITPQHPNNNTILIGVRIDNKTVKYQPDTGLDLLSIPTGNYRKFYHQHVGNVGQSVSQQIHVTNHLIYTWIRDSELYLADQPYVTRLVLDLERFRPCFELYMPYCTQRPQYRQWWC